MSVRTHQNYYGKKCNFIDHQPQKLQKNLEKSSVSSLCCESDEIVTIETKHFPYLSLMQIV